MFNKCPGKLQCMIHILTYLLKSCLMNTIQPYLYDYNHYSKRNKCITFLTFPGLKSSGAMCLHKMVSDMWSNFSSLFLRFPSPPLLSRGQWSLLAVVILPPFWVFPFLKCCELGNHRAYLLGHYLKLRAKRLYERDSRAALRINHMCHITWAFLVAWRLSFHLLIFKKCVEWLFLC